MSPLYASQLKRKFDQVPRPGPFSDLYHIVENQKADLIMKRKNRKNRGKGGKSGLEDENSKLLKIDENHIENREKYGDHRDRTFSVSYTHLTLPTTPYV